MFDRRKWEDHINKAQTKEELDTAITTIWGNLENISLTSFPTFLPKAKYVTWWTPKINTLRKRINALKRRVHLNQMKFSTVVGVLQWRTTAAVQAASVLLL